MKNSTSFTSTFFVLINVFILGLSSSCSHKQTKPEETTAEAGSADENLLGDSDSGKAAGLQTVHFAFDTALLDQGAKKTARQDAEILKRYPHLTIQIEGHCDQRGGIQYNMALGERRANSVRNYLLDLGVSANRMSIISFGKEHLLDPQDTEEAYAKNRRANFVITNKTENKNILSQR